MKLIVKELAFPIHMEWIFEQLYQEKKYAFWLDGNHTVPGLSGYSMMGGDPSFVLRIKGKSIEWIDHTGVHEKQSDPFHEIQSILDSYALTPDQEELPFIGGLVGYLGYEMGQHVHHTPVHETNPSDTPDALLMFVDRVLIYNQELGKGYITQIVMRDQEISDIECQLETWIEKLRCVMEQYKPKQPFASSADSLPDIHYVHQENFKDYMEKVVQIQEWIAQGDIYQACFTHQIEAKAQSDAFVMYQILRNINPAPFSAFIHLDHFSILSSSPERFLKAGIDKKVESRPIKGTRPRGKDEYQDRKLKEELKMSEKDQAENVMIVDLVRNDLGRVCLPGSILVSKLLNVESYATVHQLVSVVEGEIGNHVKAMEIVKATFPGGSMTGAPKKRAMEIIFEQENVKRGVYAGGLGYFDVRGNFDLSMVIRTIIYREGYVYLNVGGGIIADSNPAMEYKESMDKAFALKRAVRIALKEEDRRMQLI
ncbi:aminodeoxychorismate synthase component I [Hazenella sp. IB182357]|uniref:aminodeoxychorismate synthase n=1 Tax=Polycladospora coralii TaxID=2771432 RepID=A0A926NGX4_9BACL|nr:aminodeoxychorismate synthase component I [Polycladospora coralii]MBD1373374.1 aminodeoxychorismate synthase component I [Polycladospora coralii]